MIITTHGQVDGQKVVTKRKATPKNVGRSNATTAEEQAVIEAKAMHKFKLDRKYSLTPEAAQEDVLLPMLAKPFEKVKKIQYPVAVQPKLDGVRALARWEGDKVVLISRSGKPWLVTTHINEHLEKVMPKGTVLDGEIYLHGKGFQWITARTKKKQEGTEHLQFHVYDAPETNDDATLPWHERENNMEQVLSASCADDPVVLVSTTLAQNREHVTYVHDTAVKAGYEGAIVRTLNGLYEYGHRSSSLLKVKDFQDAEYAIVGHTSEDVERENSGGQIIQQKAVIWRCKDAATGLEFETRPRGSYVERAALYEAAEGYYGQLLKVRFFGLTDDGLPRFPVGVGIRASEDL